MTLSDDVVRETIRNACEGRTASPDVVLALAEEVQSLRAAATGAREAMNLAYEAQTLEEARRQIGPVLYG